MTALPQPELTGQGSWVRALRNVGAGCEPPCVRPALKAGLLPVWRDRDTVQVGIDPRRAVALTGMGQAALVLGLLDGSRDRNQVIVAAREQGIPDQVTDRIMTLLAAGGALDDFPAAVMRTLSQDQRRRLGAELAAAALARGHSDAGAAALVRRDAAHIQIYGPGRLANTLADILTTSGAGQVAICDVVQAKTAGKPVPAPRVSRATQPAPARGTQPAPARATRPAAAGAAQPGAARVVPSGRRTRVVQLPLPDLAILVGYQHLELPARLMRARVPHLAVSAEEAIGVVGPLVRPGQTACLRCLDLTRAGLDPAWPLILAQLVGRTTDPPACDATLAAAVAAQAAAQALAFIDRAAVGPAENGTLELVLPGWQWRRRTWPRHAACGCCSTNSVR
jgi:bacteriocin biosynthesis cyclodehydratase domain-containing protein